MPIATVGLTSLPGIGSDAAARTSGTAGAGSAFTDSLHKLLASADESNTDANNAVAGMIDGSGDVHTAMIALQRAEMTMELTVQVKNKLVQAYQDVMRMTI